jgi:endonuclease YncB( thermonuclease family)
VLAGLAAAAAPLEPHADPACELSPGPTRAVIEVIDGETLVLDDGQTVRLLGVLSPRPPDGEADASFWPPAADARAALERLAAGKTVTLGFGSGARVDRHGRTLAHVFLGEGISAAWIEGLLVEAGQVRAAALPGQGDCLESLVQREAVARAAGLGLWSHAAYHVRAASQPSELLRYRMTFQLVEGFVRHASSVRGTLYVNFGDDHRRDFTVIVRPEIARRLAPRITAPSALAGRLVRVRGWIEYRGGPAIVIEDAADIELPGPP